MIGIKIIAMNFKNLRNFKKSLLIVSALFYGFASINATSHSTHSPNRALSLADTSILTKKEIAQGWEVLFDGKNTSKWRGMTSEKFPDGWKIENGTISLENKQADAIMTREKFSNFDLIFDFNLTLGSNSGIKYFVGELKDKRNGSKVINGPEYQIIDDYNRPEVKNHIHDEGATAAAYLIYAAQNKKLNPAGQWNQGRIVARGNHIEHWLNGIKVVSYERGSKDYVDKIALTKFKDYYGYGEATTGNILITSHDDKVYFRNIKIRRL
ncbi:MAG TPA: DUF1080 domain-containing protein [Sphingobacteriaceae bacterium]|nr:DUF1080 domain-containing protein [Sphingobacteriaceae bacterium]